MLQFGLKEPAEALQKSTVECDKAFGNVTLCSPAKAMIELHKLLARV